MVPGIVAAVAGVDHDPAGAEAELAGEAVGARAVQVGRLGRRRSALCGATRLVPSLARGRGGASGSGRRRLPTAIGAGCVRRRSGGATARAAAMPSSAMARGRASSGRRRRGRPGRRADVGGRAEAPSAAGRRAEAVSATFAPRRAAPRTSITSRVGSSGRRRVLLDVLEVEHHPHHVVPVLADADLLEQAVAHREAAARRGSGCSRVPTRSTQRRSGSAMRS